MSFWIRIPLGIAIIALGIHMVWKTNPYIGLVGRIPWAEEKFGPGGTQTFLKYLGVAICFLGTFVATGLINDILGSVAGVFVRKPV